MKFIIFISDNIRHGNFPRLDRFEHNESYGKYLYLGRELSVAEFNEAAVRIFSPDFNSQGFTLRPQIVGAEIDARIAAEEAAAAELRRIANEAAGKKWLAEIAANERLAAKNAPAEAPAEKASEPVAEEAAEEPAFILDDKSILLNGERVAGLFGDDKQLRVRAEHSDLRPAIEAWLQSQLQPQ